MRVNFEIFQENSSSRDAIVDFAEGLLSFPALSDAMWDPRAKDEVARLKRRGRKSALRGARSWCTRRGYEYK